MIRRYIMKYMHRKKTSGIACNTHRIPKFYNQVMKKFVLKSQMLQVSTEVMKV